MGVERVEIDGGVAVDFWETGGVTADDGGAETHGFEAGEAEAFHE